MGIPTPLSIYTFSKIGELDKNANEG